MENHTDIQVHNRVPTIEKEAGAHPVQLLRFYHGGQDAVRTIQNIQGVDGEILCASTSPNVARRYGDVVSRFRIAEKANVCTMSLQEWFVPQADLGPDELFTDRLRSEGYDAVIVLGDAQSYDFPAPTLFLLNPAALQFESQMSPIELTILDDGLSYVMDPVGPDARGYDLWMKNFSDDMCGESNDPDDNSETFAPGM